jgi:hypothetical protein
VSPLKKSPKIKHLKSRLNTIKSRDSLKESLIFQGIKRNNQTEFFIEH